LAPYQRLIIIRTCKHRLPDSLIIAPPSLENITRSGANALNPPTRINTDHQGI
jgi:hypothetical protein